MNQGPGIIMDIITVGILLLSMIFGARKGFAMTVMSFVQWFGCIVAGLIFGERAKEALIEKTLIDETINEQILNHIETTIEESSSYLAMPDLFASSINGTTGELLYGTAGSITSVIMTVLGFLTVVLGIKIVSFFFVHIFSRKYHDGVAGFFDGFLGFLFGIGRGILLILLFYTVLVPVLGVIWPSFAEFAVTSIDDSYTAKLLYDNNMLLILLRDFFV